MRLWPRLRWVKRDGRDRAPTEADRALEVSEAQRERAEQERERFERLAVRIRTMREHNHLAEALRRAMEDGR